MGLVPQPLTESDFAKYSTEFSTAYTSPQAQERVDQTNKQQKSNKQQVVGSFNELDGIVTEAQVKSMEKKSGQKVKLMSLEEAARQSEVEKEVMLSNMPEDAIMIQGQGGSERFSSGVINQSHNGVTQESDSLEDCQFTATMVPEEHDDNPFN